MNAVRSIFVATICVASGCASGTPRSVSALAVDADRYEVLSLDASRPEHADLGFHGYPVLGAAHVDDRAVRKQLDETIRRSSAPSETSVLACRFEPQYGIQIVRQGVTTDFVVCMHCGEADAYQDGRFVEHFAIAVDTRGAFDDALRRVGIHAVAGGSVGKTHASTAARESVRSAG